MDRRAFIQRIASSLAGLGLGPALTGLGLPASAEAGLFDTPHARATMAAFADTVIPPGDTPGASASGFVDFLYDPDLVEALLGFDIPLAAPLRALVLDLDSRSKLMHGSAFKALDLDRRIAVVARALGTTMGLVYQGIAVMVKVCYFGGQRSDLGWQQIGYPGPAMGYILPVGPPPCASGSEDGNPP